jgi:hypothetical protein
MPCSVVVGTIVLKDHAASIFVLFTLKMEAARSSETLLSYYNMTW